MKKIAGIVNIFNPSRAVCKLILFWLGIGMALGPLERAQAKGHGSSNKKIVIKAASNKRQKGYKSLKEIRGQTKEKNSKISKRKNANTRLLKSRIGRKHQKRQREKFISQRKNRSRSVQWMAKRNALKERARASKSKKK